jgi:ferredoxin-NADP reductase
MSARDYIRDIDGYEALQREIAVSRKYGADPTAERGKWARAVNLLHPERLALRVSEIIAETPTAKTLRLVSADGWLPPFQAGQSINVFVEAGGVRTSRPYSISSSPRQRAFYDITIRRVEDGFVSNVLLDGTRVGDVLDAASPAGNFYFNPLFHSPDMVCLAGGSGVTPFMSMICEIAEAGLDRRLTLLYGSRTEGDIIFARELEGIAARHGNIRYVPVISEPGAGCGHRTGFLTASLIREVLGETGGRTFYLCGPAEMYTFCLPELENLGIPRGRVRREMYGSPKDVTADPAWPADVPTGRTFEVEIRGRKKIPARAGEPLLIALERAGIVVPAQCRSGECSLCRVKLLGGRVFQPQGVLLRKSDRTFGYIHSCMAWPISDLEIMV